MANPLKSKHVDYGKLKDDNNLSKDSLPLYGKKQVGGRTYKVLKNEDAHHQSSLSKLGSTVKRKCSKCITMTFSRTPS